MKLEVGMYVRTDNGIIGKIYEEIGDMFTYKDSNRDYITYDLLHSEIIKASYNIIDILEVGDYVNGQVVTQIIPNNRKTDPSTMIYTGTNHVVGLYNEDIEDVITKEQFEQMKYRIGE